MINIIFLVRIRVGGQTPRGVENTQRSHASIFKRTSKCFEIEGSSIYEYLNILFKLSPVSQKNLGEIHFTPISKHPSRC